MGYDLIFVLLLGMSIQYNCIAHVHITVNNYQLKKFFLLCIVVVVHVRTTIS